MKPFFSNALLAALLAVGTANAATTTPVGYVSLAVPASSDTTIAPALERASLFTGASTGISGNVITASGLTDGAYVTTQSYVQVTSGSLAGRRFPVTANTATTVTVDPVLASTLQAQGFTSGTTFKVVPYWTLSTLFPAGAGVGATADVFDVSSVLFVVDNGSYGVNKAPSASYFYCSGDEGNGVAAGWYDANDPFGASKDSLVLDPTIAYIVRNGSGSANTVTVSGQVPSVSSSAIVPVDGADQNDVQLGIPLPVDTTLQASGLQSVIQGTNDVFNVNELVFVFDDTGSGQNKAPSASYFYCTGDEGNGVAAGWYDANDPFGAQVTGDVLKAGRCIILRKAAAGTQTNLVLNTSLPYTL